MAEFLRVAVEKSEERYRLRWHRYRKTTLLNVLSNFIPQGERINGGRLG